MQTRRIRPRFLVAASLITLLMAGCPAGDLLQNSNLDQFLGSLTDAEVLQRLGEFLDDLAADEAAADQIGDAFATTAGEAPYFGEDASQYDAVNAATLEIDADSLDAALDEDVGGARGTRNHNDAVVVVRGGLAGRFENRTRDSTSDTSGGVFRGRWFNADGAVIGWIRGEYHPIRAQNLPDGLTGGGVFHGKIIDADGTFIGLLRGRYGHADNGPGMFRGEWFDRFDRLIGRMRGRWVDDAAINGGEFAGRWAAFRICREAEMLPPDVSENEPVDAIFDELDAIPVNSNIDEEFSESDVIDDDIGTEIDLTTGAAQECVDPRLVHGYFRGWHGPLGSDDGDAPDWADGALRGEWRDAANAVEGYVVGYWASRPPNFRPTGDEDDDADGDDDDHRASHDESSGLNDRGTHRDERPLRDILRHRRSSRDDHARGPRVGGNFAARIVDTDGVTHGYLRGVYGVGPRELHVFHAKFYDEDRNRLGRMYGRWSNDPMQPGGPVFGVWIGREDPLAVSE